MIIVSQDRKRIVENLNLGIRNKGEYNQNYVIYNTEIGEDLGEYATEERAKEVLREIIEFLDRKSLVGMDRDGITMQVLGNIYRMPKE